MFKSTLERLMKAELEDHLGYAHDDVRNKKTENCRSGTYKKTVNRLLAKSRWKFPETGKAPITP
jgi:transposase-like protein